MVFDPSAGSGTMLKVARKLGTKGIGYEIDLELRHPKEKTWRREFPVEEREGAKRLRKFLRTKVQRQRSVVR